MSTAEKTLAAMRRSPLDWRLADLQAVARWKDVTWRHRGGSHCIFVRPNGQTLSVPAKRPIKPVYIKMFLALVDGDQP